MSKFSVNSNRDKNIINTRFVQGVNVAPVGSTLTFDGYFTQLSLIGYMLLFYFNVLFILLLFGALAYVLVKKSQVKLSWLFVIIRAVLRVTPIVLSIPILGEITH